MNRMRFFPTLSPYHTAGYTVVNRPGTTETVDFVPGADIAESENSFLVWVSLPGVKKSDVNLSVDNDELIIIGKTADRQAEGLNFRRRGIATGEFRKVFTLSEGIDHEGISAEFEEGLLKVTLPKAPEAQKRNISIQ
ncbi:MAG: Hsp20/alpha crystallin family protein [Bacteroidota bacterium]